MSPKFNDVICNQRRRTCKFLSDGICTILKDTHFKRPCPFYKEIENAKKVK